MLKQEIKDAIVLLIENGYRVEKISAIHTVMNKVQVDDSEEQKNLKMLIDDIGLPIRARNAFLAENITTVGDLLKLTKQDLDRFPNMGKKASMVVLECLATMNLSLKPIIGK